MAKPANTVQCLTPCDVQLHFSKCNWVIDLSLQVTQFRAVDILDNLSRDNLGFWVASGIAMYSGLSEQPAFAMLSAPWGYLSAGLPTCNKYADAVKIERIGTSIQMMAQQYRAMIRCTEQAHQPVTDAVTVVRQMAFGLCLTPPAMPKSKYLAAAKRYLVAKYRELLVGYYENCRSVLSAKRYFAAFLADALDCLSATYDVLNKAPE